ncbi:hypothetical protein HYPSUDRAFT_146932 [Hypholoma sublateritium FD-334 SS-4]|uniref:Tyrosinase copper-binding domain-containing protein n=1 Tax=Hypholoma sublateritium (strain FD-334 SS-4) TaxID=945553 RepID=A0A0D2KQZ9_HYPSF|nr:hypothetical protein HYPSUDRAFT_146932 [Hypholoma sublateritium FD-334 SS-4]
MTYRRTLSRDEKAEYIKAVQCLQSHPAVDPVMPEARTRFDEFQAYHIQVADGIHLLGQFLPWHRHYIRSYEKALRNQCGYEGSFPYWDWSRDVTGNNSISTSPVFDPATGFGSNGIPGTYTLPPNNATANLIFAESFRGCVADGPFANYTLSLGPGKLATRHCLTRGFSDAVKYALTAAAVANATRATNFEGFRTMLEGDFSSFRPHNGGHVAVGGEMSNFYSSPGEPLFWLHHANLDRIWWTWQNQSPSHLYEVSGPTTKTGPRVELSLDYILKMGSMGPSVTVRDVMDLHAEPNCYTYV